MQPPFGTTAATRADAATVSFDGGAQAGDVRAPPGLSRRDRRVVTVSALIAMNRPTSSGRTSPWPGGTVTRDELVEATTHLAFYAGWPSAVSAVGVAKEGLPERRRAGPVPAAVHPTTIRGTQR